MLHCVIARKCATCNSKKSRTWFHSVQCFLNKNFARLYDCGACYTLQFRLQLVSQQKCVKSCALIAWCNSAFKALSHDAIFRATCNAILPLVDVKLANTSFNHSLLKNFNTPNICHKFTSLKNRTASQVARKIAPCDRVFSQVSWTDSGHIQNLNCFNASKMSVKKLR